MTGIALGAALLLGAALGWSGPVLMAGVAAVGFAGWGRRAAWLVLLVPCALLGAWRVHPYDVQPLPTRDEPAWIEASVSSGPLETANRQRFDLQLPGGGRLCVTGPVAPALVNGDVVVVYGRIIGLDDVDDRSAGFLRSRGCGGSLIASELSLLEPGVGIRSRLDHVRREMTAALQRAAPGDAGALMAGLVTGDDTALTRRSRDAFIDTGTSHVTAVSGSNLALIAAMLALGGLAIGHVRSGWWQAATAGALWLYVAMIGAAPPAFRAAMVATLAVLALRLGRRPDLVTISVLVAAAEVVARPGDFASLSYRLSTVSAIALVLGLAGRSMRGATSWLRAGVIATLITQVATAPLLVPVFGRVSVLAVPANLVVAPLCAAAFPVALVAGLIGLKSDELAAIVAAPAHLLSLGALAFVTRIAELPGAERPGALLTALPTWLLSLLAAGIVVAMSRECRGGIARRLARSFPPGGRPLAAIAGAVGGVIAGGLLTAVLR